MRNRKQEGSLAAKNYEATRFGFTVITTQQNEPVEFPHGR